MSYVMDDERQELPTFYRRCDNYWREIKEDEQDLDEQGQGIVHEEDSNTRGFMYELETKNLSVKVLHVKLYPGKEDTCEVMSVMKGEAIVCLRTTNAKNLLNKVMEDVYERGDENQADTIQREVTKAREVVWYEDEPTMNEDIACCIGLGVEAIYHQCKLGVKKKKTGMSMVKCPTMH